MKKLVFLLVLSLFLCINVQTQTFNISLVDSPDPSYGVPYTFEVTANFSQSTLGKIWIDVSVEHEVTEAVKISSSGFTTVTSYPPGSTISHSNGNQIISTYYLFSGFVDGYGGQDLKFKYKITPSQSGFFKIKFRATYINGLTTIRYPSTGGCGTDQQGWRTFCEDHTHSGLQLPDLTVQDVKILEGSAYNGIPVNLRATIKELANVSVSSTFKVGFYVNNQFAGYKSVSSLSGGASKNVDLPYTFQNSGAHTIKAVADYEFVITETNENNNSYSREITVIQNQPPTVSIATPQINGKNVTFNWLGTDPDNQTLLYRYKLGSGAWSDWLSSTTVTYNNQPSGQSTFYVEVKDPGGLVGSDSESFSIVNHAPTLTHIGNKTVDEGQLLEFFVSGSDPDGDVLVYSVQNKPEGSVFDATTKKFSWTPTFQQSGTYNNIKFIVDDGEVSAYENITITVVNITSNAPVEAWPEDNVTLNAIVPQDKELFISWYVGATQNITSTTFSFWSTASTTELFDVTLTPPNSSPIVYPNVSQKEISRLFPEAGFWRVGIKTINGSSGNIKVVVNYNSSIASTLPIIYFKTIGELPVIGWGLMTGVCPDDDYVCISTDIAVGIVPVTGPPKDVVQACISTIIGCGYGAVGFIRNDPEQIAKAKTYLKAAGLAVTSIGLTFAAAWWVDDAIRAGKLGKGTIKPIKLFNNFKLVGRQTELPFLAKEIDKHKHVMLVDELVSRPYIEKLAQEGISVDARAVNTAMAKVLSHPDARFVPHAVYTGNEMEGLGYDIFARLVHPEMPITDLRRWDFTTAVFSKTQPTGLTKLTDADVVVKDITTGRYAIIEVTNNMGESHNALQIDKIRNALASSVDPSIAPYKGNTDVFGWVNKNTIIHPKLINGIMSEVDTVFIHNMKPTYVIIDSAKKELNLNKITFHTESEVDNSGFLVVRCKTTDTVFQVASTFIPGAGNSNTRKDYIYLDYFAEPNVNYKYLIYQYNIFSYLVYVSDTAKIYSTTDIKDEAVPASYSLLPLYPNPFNPETRITFELPEATDVSIEIYDVLGKKVSDLTEDYYPIGRHYLSWSPKDLSSGTYIVVMKTNKFTATNKVMYLK